MNSVLADIYVTEHSNFIAIVAIKLLMLCLLVLNPDGIQAQNQAPYIDTLSTCTSPLTPTTLCDSYTDPDGDAVVIVDGYTTFNCSLTFLNDSCVRYTPLPGFVGTDTIFLEICDTQTPPACAVTLVTVNVGCLPPIAATDYISIATTYMLQNGTASNIEYTYLNGVVLDVTQNDNIVCGTSLTVPNVISPPAFGDYSLINNNEIHYIPNEGFVGTDSLQYVTCNNCPLCDTTNVLIEVFAPDFTCNSDIYDCLGAFSTIDICPTFCNIATNQIATITSAAVHGSIDPVINNCALYIPDPTFTGIDLVSFIACNTDGSLCDTTAAYITIDPTCGDNPPVANNDMVSAIANAPLIIEVLNNDYDIDGQGLLVVEMTAPSNGTAQIDPNYETIIYTADIGFIGVDSFTYTICDETNFCETASVIIEVQNIDVCNEKYEFCTAMFTPVEFCVNFCDLIGSNNVSIAEANTTFNCSLVLLDDTCIRYTPLPAFEGTDVVTIIGCNDAGLCDTTLVTVHVGCVSPQAHDDEGLSENGENIIIDVLTNDLKPCENTLMTTVVVPPINGTATVNANGSITYNPNADFVGTEVIVYEVCNVCASGNNVCDEATIWVTVEENGFDETIFISPKAKTDVVYATFQTAKSIPVLNNDLGTNISIQTYTQPQNGYIIQEDESLIYQPNTSYTGLDYFLYTICNTIGNCDQTLVSITVLENGTALEPIANNDVYYTNVNAEISIEVLQNDIDPEGGNLTISNFGIPENGQFVQLGNILLYTPNTGFNGLEEINYEVCDEQGLCVQATVFVAVGIVNELNEKPILKNDIGLVELGMSIDINVLGNDSDPNLENELSAMLLSNPINGIITNANAGNFTYQPNPGFEGVDYFVYFACDNGTPVLCDTAYVAMIVGASNVAPIANNDVAYGTINSNLNALVLANDSDLNHLSTELSITEIITSPLNGNVNNENTYLVYTPNPNFVGTDLLTYLLCDPEGACDTATLSIYINPLLSATPDIAATTIYTPIEINALTNDEGGFIEITSIGLATNGIAQLLPNGNVLYTPNQLFSGEDYILYQVCDVQGNCVASLIHIMVVDPSLGLAPIAVNDLYTINANENLELKVLQNDFDLLESELSITNTSSPQFGTLQLNANGDGVQYNPDWDFNGIDQFTYTICNANAFCDTALVVLQVGGGALITNEKPNAFPDVSLINIGDNVTINVLTNDNDPDSDILNLNFVTNPMHGSVENLGGGELNYLPNELFEGEDYFLYTICDEGFPLQCDTSYVFVNVIDMHSNNVGVFEEILEDNDVTICLSEIFGPNFAIDNIEFVELPMHGFPYFLEEEEDCIAYSPNANYFGLDELVIEICNEEGICDSLEILVDVLPVNDAPIALNDVDTTFLNTPITVQVLDNDYDPDYNDLYIYAVNEPQYGMYDITFSGIEYTPAVGFTGIDEFDYTITDSYGVTNTASVKVVVLESAPIASSSVTATDDFDTTYVNVTHNILVLNNDIFPNNNNVTINLISMPLHANAVVNEMENGIVFSPEQYFDGTDMFEYSLCENGICDTAEVHVFVKKQEDNETCRLNIATAFSPNGDGINDEFLIETNNCTTTAAISVRIFNRWGDVVFKQETYSHEEAWNGKLYNGEEEVIDGTYFYLIEITTHNDASKEQKSGYLELRR